MTIRSLCVTESADRPTIDIRLPRKFDKASIAALRNKDTVLKTIALYNELVPDPD